MKKTYSVKVIVFNGEREWEVSVVSGVKTKEEAEFYANRFCKNYEGSHVSVRKVSIY